MDNRKIIHVDMDAFYASVEQRDNPKLKGKPVIVGGKPGSRGVVAACSYEARKFGIHSAMASSRACRLCPDAVFLRPRFSAYKEASSIIRNIFFEYTDLVEPLSLDEAYLDVTKNKKNNPLATNLAKEIKNKIFSETGLTASAGVSFNKFLAKVASDFNKPDGITVITPHRADEFVNNLPIRKFFGIGKATEKKMSELGIFTGADLKEISRPKLKEIFGKYGEFYFNIVRCIDNRSVNPYRIRKSMGKETTLQNDIDKKEEMWDILNAIALQLEHLVSQENVKSNTLTLKVKFFDFKSVTRSITIDELFNDHDIMVMHAKRLLEKTEAGLKKVRLLGLSLSNFNKNVKYENNMQLEFPFE